MFAAKGPITASCEILCGGEACESANSDELLDLHVVDSWRCCGLLSVVCWLWVAGCGLLVVDMVLDAEIVILRCIDGRKKKEVEERGPILSTCLEGCASHCGRYDFERTCRPAAYSARMLLQIRRYGSNAPGRD